jgi:hypothetical protein
MASEVTREEHQHLVVRVDVLEREVEGEKMVTRHILEQTRRNGDDLAAIKTRLGRVEGKVEGLESKVEGLESKVDRIETTLQGLIRSLPTIVADAVRSALPKGGKR